MHAATIHPPITTLALVLGLCFLSACGVDDAHDPDPEPASASQVSEQTEEIAGVGQAHFGSTDNDEDGYFTPDDCDDSDPTINPGAGETCDDVDRNCDGIFPAALFDGEFFADADEALDAAEAVTAANPLPVIFCRSAVLFDTRRWDGATHIAFDAVDPSIKVTFNIYPPSTEPCFRLSGNASVEIGELTLSHCKSNAVLAEDSATIELNNTRFEAHRSSSVEQPFYNGAAIHLRGASQLHATDAHFINNRAYFGGAIFADGESALADISGGTFDDNHATQGSGGAIRGRLGAEIRLRDVVFLNNGAAWDAGALSCGDCQLQAERLEFYGNVAGRHGGAVVVRDFLARDNTLVSPRFIDNVAGDRGGAIYVWHRGFSGDYPFAVDGGDFFGNIAGDGGAIFAGSWLPPTTTTLAISGTFRSNISSRGSAIYLSDGAVADLTGSDFSDNTGPAIYLNLAEEVPGGRVIGTASFPTFLYGDNNPADIAGSGDGWSIPPYALTMPWSGDFGPVNLDCSPTECKLSL